MDHDGVLESESAGEESPVQRKETSDHIREMQRFYTLAKHQAWKVEQLSWGHLPPVPEGKGSGEQWSEPLRPVHAHFR